MVSKPLKTFVNQKNSILTSIAYKISNGLFDQSLHSSFKGSRLDINDIEQIIDSIEYRIRKIQTLCYTYFDSEYDASIIVNQTLQTNKVIETEFNFGTYILRNRIEINDHNLYKEMIDTNFQSFILAVASVYEILVRLSENILKKIVIYDGIRSPYQSLTLKTFIHNWDRLIDLGYRKNDQFYDCFSTHRVFLDKYLDQINTLRNKFIHGYSLNLAVNNLHNTYMVQNHDEKNFPAISGGGLITDLVVDSFVKDVKDGTINLTEDLLDIYKIKLGHHRTKIPI